MGRTARLVVSGQPLHITHRGVNRCALFTTTDDFLYYQRLLSRASTEAQCDVHAYVLMTNHAHLLLTPHRKDSAAAMMHVLGTRFVRRHNVREGRTGPLWDGRYRSALIDSERYFFTCSRYIELNPVRAGMVASPSQYKWSSYRGNALGQVDTVITPHPLFRALGMSPCDQHRSYLAMFNVPLADEMIDVIRERTRAGVPMSGPLKGARAKLHAGLRGQSNR